MNRRAVMIGLTALAACAPFAAHAQTYPDRPIRLMVSFAPGGVTDVIGRLWAERMKPVLGTVIIENQGGAGGAIAAGEVARAQADGYTLLFGTTGTQVINPQVSRVSYDPLKDFAAVSIIAISAVSIAVNPALPVHSVKELIAYAKANPDKLSYGSAGTGTLTQLAGEMFKQLAGTPGIVHIPYKGAGPGLTDLVSGHIPMMAPNVTAQVLDLHRAGKIRIIAVTTSERLAAAPDIPTAVDSGLPGMVAQLFTGLFAPAATPKPIVEKIAAATHTAMADRAFQDLMIKSGFEPVIDSNPDKAQRFVGEEHVRLTPVMKAANLKVE
jgi:tripartite-type tricarboxylate transporter receptor subunit TctC